MSSVISIQYASRWHLQIWVVIVLLRMLLSIGSCYPYLCCSLLDETDEEVRTKEDDGVAAAVDVTVTVAGGAQPQADGQPDPQPPTPPW